MKRVHENISEGRVDAKLVFRDRIDLLRSRASLLGGTDRLIMKMYLDNGNTFRQMAALAGVNEATIARKIHKIIKRLIDSEYIMCLRNRDKFSSLEMAIAKDYFLKGLSIRSISVKQKLTYYRVRQTLKKIQKLITVDEQQSYRKAAGA